MNAILLIALATSLAGGPGGEVYGFGESLFAGAEYYRAVSEYLRYLHVWPTGPHAALARIRIADSYFLGGRYRDAARAYEEAAAADDPIRSRAADGLCRSLLLAGEGRRLLDPPAAEGLRVPPDVVGSFRGWALFSQGDYAGALRAEEAWKVEHPAPAAEGLALFREGAVFRPKSPGLSAVLSALLPGAGQVYARRPGDAVILWLTLPVLAGLAWESFRRDSPTLGITFSTVGGVFYLGNVYGAFASANRFNRLSNEDLQSRARERLVRAAIVPGAEP